MLRPKFAYVAIATMGMLVAMSGCGATSSSNHGGNGGGSSTKTTKSTST
jgi:hypothetical protein